MILLDENIRQDQGVQLRQWRIRFRFVVNELAPSGIQDAEIIPLLLKLKQPAFFTHDRDFFRKNLIHAHYCLVWLDIFDGEAAKFIRAFLKHPLFNTAAGRNGIVARVRGNGIQFWKGSSSVLKYEAWARGLD